MTEKQFYIDTIDGGESVLTDNGKELSLNETCNLLNELAEENDELKYFIQELTTKGTGKIYLLNDDIYKVNAILIDFKW